MLHVTKQFQHLKIQLEAILSATNNFSNENCIGNGGFGKVYKGELIDSEGRQTVVAIKRLNRAYGQGDPEFWKEIIMLSRYKHENIVSLLGFCDESGEKILVYEYASKKSLDLYLKSDDLTWIQRLKICIGAARGLAYLHNPGGTQQRVLHRDIKSSNILLDENWNARISDFGLSKFGPANQQITFLVSNAVGTIGYCDPVYVETGVLTKASDVYSFGVVLFEVLCGRLCIGNNNDKHRPMTELARQCYEQDKVHEIIYGNIKDEIKPKSLRAFTAIAYQCLNRDLEQRPLMTNVVRILERALEHQGDANSSVDYDTNDGDVVESDFSTLEGVKEISRNFQFLWFDEGYSQFLFSLDNLLVLTDGKLSMIQSLLRKLRPDDQRTAAGEIRLLSKRNADNRAAIAEAGAIPLLTQLLTAPDLRTQEHAVTALLNLSICEENKGSIVSSGAVPGIVQVLKKGSMEARENAAATLFSLSVIDENKVAIGSLEAIPPLVLLLGEGTQRGKKDAATALFNLCIFQGNKVRAVRAGVIPTLMELLTEPQGGMKDEALAILAILANHPEGNVAIGKAEAVPVLVEFMRSGSERNKENAAAVLVHLCSVDNKHVVEAQEAGAMEVVVDLLQHGTPRGKRKAGQLLEKMSRLVQEPKVLGPTQMEWKIGDDNDNDNNNHRPLTGLARQCYEQHKGDANSLADDEDIVESDFSTLDAGTSGNYLADCKRSMVQSLLRKLNSGSPNDQRSAAREIRLLAKRNADNRAAIAEAGAIPLLTHFLTSPDSRTQEHAVTALLNLSICDENKGSIVSSGAVPGIIQVLTEGSMEARENAAATLFSLSVINENKVAIGSLGAIPPLILLLGEGTQRGKKDAATALYNLCIFQGNKGRAVRAGVIPTLMELLTEPQGGMKDEALAILAILASHPEGIVAIGKAEAVQVLVEFMRSGSERNKENAASVLVHLCSVDEKHVVEAQGAGAMEAVVDLLHHGTPRGKRKAEQLLEKIAL
ncbi:hypothetical protein OSB04_030447 [Centaurea solstitialis]|uniref:RING-type E3 ubiquitin transferase n=1 Tax=Centaurea solstitialis TaxID=347529 RepID=A0AA38S8T3_9ASTR|nr:hypothetical protein OSB04_030447 [Centaurea solstitialis]